jgi:hypothetical protein
MSPAILLALALAPGADPLGKKSYGPAYIRPEAPFGYLYQPAYDLNLVARTPATRYEPQPGDILLLSDTNLFWTSLYLIAASGKPGHSGSSPGCQTVGSGFWKRGIAMVSGRGSPRSTTGSTTTRGQSGFDGRESPSHRSRTLPSPTSQRWRLTSPTPRSALPCRSRRSALADRSGPRLSGRSVARGTGISVLRW